MAVALAAVMRQIRNYFNRGDRPYSGEVTITGNVLLPAQAAPYVAIHGSAWHDGVYAVIGGALQDVPDGLPDETFTGLVWHLYPPADFLDLCKQISAYDDKHPTGAYASETFGDYSYSRSGGAQPWQQAYAAQLNAYRRMFTEVEV